MPGGWNSSKLFRWQAHAMFVHLCKQEKRWREIVESKVKVYTPEEIIAFGAQTGQNVSQSVFREANDRRKAARKVQQKKAA